MNLTVPWGGDEGARVKRTQLAVAGLMLAMLAACSSGGSDAGSGSAFCDAARTAKASTDAQQGRFQDYTQKNCGITTTSES